ncbi:MAG TPA: hypothetical protein VMK32_02640 [Burkholderiaceae bacterium]|nr:hypothetical protein [Burkholderiaceae bacterium]
MPFTLTIEQKDGYLHAVVTGDNTKEDILGYLRELMQECRARAATRLLIEERLSGPRLGPVDVFDIAAQGNAKAVGPLHAIAYVDVNAVGQTMKFAENVAVNRGLPIRMFDTVIDAEKWLLGQ